MILRELAILTKPRITLLGVATAAVGLLLAPGDPPAALAAATLVGILFLVGSANALNMLVERDVDALMERTRNRPLPAGRLSPRAALWFGLGEAAVAVPLLALFANATTGLLGAVALFLYVLVYTPLKRKTPLALLVGAVSGAMPPLMGWTAAAGRIEVGALALFAVLLVWQVPHFLAIALFRKADYAAAGLRVLPAVSGDAVTRKAIAVGVVVQVATTLLLVPHGVGGPAAARGAVVLGAIMLALAFFGLVTRGGEKWARGVFVASIVYLPALFALLLV